MKIIRSLIASAAGFAAVAVMPLQAYAQTGSCSDLWYQRNQLYANYMYCFKTARAQNTFGLYPTNCATSNPKFTKAERNLLKAIIKAEKRKGCR